MAAGNVQIADVVVPAIFNPYVQELTQEKTAIIRSGAVVIDSQLASNLAGEGSTFNVRSYKDLQNDAENVSSDVAGNLSTPNKILSATEIQVRLSRNNSWASMDLVTDLISKDPMQAIASRVSDYWVRRLQLAFVNTVKGVLADNALAPNGNDTHIQNDMTFNASGAAFAAGVTNFTAESFVDATTTMGDSLNTLTMIMVHSVVYGRMIKNNLIDFVPDSTGSTNIPTFMGRTVIVDDGMPFTGGVFESWLFGANAFTMGMSQPKVPTEIYRLPAAGNGAGMETLFNRVEWAIHPSGYQYTPAYTVGGPTNATLALAASWSRVFPERKQIRMARLITREF
jgi:hypothetical protein